MNTKTELFLDKYKQLEAAVSAQYNLGNFESAVSFLERRPEYQRIRSELAYCREVRNLLTHRPKLGDRYAVEPSDEMLALLDRTMNQVLYPQKAKHIWVPKSRVICASMEDFVRPAMAEMNEHLYTHIPILEKDVVIGVFSENTLLSYLQDAETISIGQTVRFADIKKYLPLCCHRTESFRFVGKNTPVSEIEDIFAEADKRRDRIGLIFVTNSGNPSEKLLGIISPWDVAGID